MWTANGRGRVAATAPIYENKCSVLLTSADDLQAHENVLRLVIVKALIAIPLLEGMLSKVRAATRRAVRHRYRR